jgi:hypothetical protein
MSASPRCRILAAALLAGIAALALPAIAQRRPLTGPEPLHPVAARAAVADPSFRLVNRDVSTVHEIYVSPAAERGWGADWLGLGVLVSVRYAPISLPVGQCINDVRVVFSDGRAVERRRVDTCALADLAFP